MSLLMVLAALMLMGRFFPETPFGTWCHHITTARIAHLIDGIERRHVIMLLIGVVAIQAFAMAMPLDMAFFAMLDTATYIDVVLAVWAMNSFGKAGAAYAWARSRIRMIRATKPRRAMTRHAVPRRHRIRQVKPSATSRNGLDPWGDRLAA